LVGSSKKNLICQPRGGGHYLKTSEKYHTFKNFFDLLSKFLQMEIFCLKIDPPKP
jgi:hypothetical protein